ncbi:hypothetical protein ACHQM5_006665 [Ranunculus cassubicifolius]
MATQTSPTPNPPSAQVVGNAFVEQYYHILHQSPELVFRFYMDSSVLSRPGPDGNMVTVKTMQAINEVILSLDYKDYKAEIRTIDSQDSYKEGVLVFVTGWLTMKDTVKRKFTQSFFLAPQDKGYFVLNDVFRYVDEDTVPQPPAVAVNGFPENVPAAPVTSDPEPTHIPEQVEPEKTIPVVEVAYGNGEVVHAPTENGEVSAVEVQVVEAPVPSVQKEVAPAAAPTPEPAPAVQEDAPDAPKKSYASIVMKPPTKTAPVYATPKKITVTPKKPAPVVAEQQSAPEAPAPSSNNGSSNGNVPEEVEGYSVYVRSLPLNATVQQVEEEFKRFGEIRPNGVQVRSNKGFCFGFVEFVTLESKQNALQASPFPIMGRQAHVEEKRTTTRIGPNGRPRGLPQRNGYNRSDSFRGNDSFRGGRGNYSNGGGRGYGRNEYGNSRGDFSSGGRRGGRGGENYQRAENGGGNGGNVRVSRQIAVVA